MLGQFGIDEYWLLTASIWGMTLIGLWLASGVVCSQPVHNCVLVGVFGWHIAGRRQVEYLRQGSSTWRCCCCCRGWGVMHSCSRLCVVTTMPAVRGRSGCAKAYCAFCSWLALMSIFSPCARDGNVVVQPHRCLLFDSFPNRRWCSHTSQCPFTLGVKPIGVVAVLG